MPNNDYILRSDALKAARYYKNRREENHVPSIDDVHLTEYQLLAQAINSIPAADVEPVIHGRWIPIHELRPDGYPLSVPTCFWCDQCKYSSESPRKFCPNCGAKMQREEDDV